MLDRTRQPAGTAEVTLAARLPLAMLQTLAARWGVDADALARTAGLDAHVLADPDGRVPGTSMERFWEAAVAATGDPHLGLHLGAAAEMSSLATIGYVLQSTPTLGAALDALSRYVPLFTDGLGIQVERPAPRALDQPAILDFEALGAPERNYLLRSPRQPMEATIAGSIVLAGVLAGRPLPILALDFAHPGPPGAAAEVEEVLGTLLQGPVRYGAARHRIYFDARALQWPIVRASPLLLSAFEARAAEAVETLARHAPSPFQDRVVRVVAQQLRGTVPTLATTAAALALGERTLQRRLEAEGTSYTAVLDAARHTLARQQLAAADVTVADVAFLLGFSEPSAFARAFRRWTGLSPSAYRRQALRSGR